MGPAGLARRRGAGVELVAIGDPGSAAHTSLSTSTAMCSKSCSCSHLVTTVGCRCASLINELLTPSACSSAQTRPCYNDEQQCSRLRDDYRRGGRNAVQLPLPGEEVSAVGIAHHAGGNGSCAEVDEPIGQIDVVDVAVFVVKSARSASARSTNKRQARQGDQFSERQACAVKGAIP